MTLSGRLAGRDYLPEALAPGLLIIPWAVQAQRDPTDLTSPIADGLIPLKSGVSARNAASIPGAARVGEMLTTGIPEFAHTHALRHSAFTCLCVPDDGAADAGLPDATGTTCPRSDEDDGASINARVPIPGYPALSFTTPPPVAGDRASVLWRRAQPYRVQSGKVSGSCLETHGAYRSSAGLRSCNCAYDIPKFTTSPSERVDSR